jgi:hypothetical protein
MPDVRDYGPTGTIRNPVDIPHHLVNGWLTARVLQMGTWQQGSSRIVGNTRKEPISRTPPMERRRIWLRIHQLPDPGHGARRAVSGM